MSKILLLPLLFLMLSSCATPLKTSQIRAKLQPGMSRADVLMIMSLPDAEQKPAPGRHVFTYYDTGIYFVNDKLVYIFDRNSADADLVAAESRLATDWNQIPDIRNKLAFNPELEANKKGPVNAYRAFFYLQDENFFREAIRHKIDPEGYSTDLNALCLAIRGDFSEAFRELLLINVETDVILRDHRAGRSYARMEECPQFQEDKGKAAKYSQALKDHAEALKTKPTTAHGTEAVGENKKSVVNWDAIQDWLKPQVPTPTSGPAEKK